MVIKKIGTLCLDGQTRQVGAEYDGEKISFGPPAPGKEIECVSTNNLLIANRCVCRNISWEQLHAQGLVFGIPVQIGKEFYLCRCLKVGAKEGVSKNEWENAVNATMEDDRIWHWKKQYFWGQENVEADRRAVRGVFRHVIGAAVRNPIETSMWVFGLSSSIWVAPSRSRKIWKARWSNSMGVMG